jgi:hypothetical protein
MLNRIKLAAAAELASDLIETRTKAGDRLE